MSFTYQQDHGYYAQPGQIPATQEQQPVAGGPDTHFNSGGQMPEFGSGFQAAQTHDHPVGYSSLPAVEGRVTSGAWPQ